MTGGHRQFWNCKCSRRSRRPIPLARQLKVNLGRKKILEGLHMRRVVVVLALLALALPMAAWADDISIVNQAGNIAISNMTGTGGAGTIGASTVTSNQSQLTSFDGFTSSKGADLGRVNFATGALLSGTVSGGGVFSATGSSFTVIGQGKWLAGL